MFDRMARLRSVFLIGLLLLTGPFPTVRAAGEIQIEQTAVQEIPPDRYEMTALVRNKSTDSREVVLRAQLFFFDEASPPGDIPLMILRKDETIVLKNEESRMVRIRLINEGTLPKSRLRLEPEIRIRRQRPWNY